MLVFGIVDDIRDDACHLLKFYHQNMSGIILLSADIQHTLYTPCIPFILPIWKFDICDMFVPVLEVLLPYVIFIFFKYMR